MARASAKNRLRQNKQRLRVLQLLLLGVNAAYLARLAIKRFPPVDTVLVVLNNAVMYIAYATLSSAATPNYDVTSGELVDAGADLSSAGVLEYCNDLVYVCGATQLLASVSQWFWLLALVVPAFAGYKAWRHVIRPYVLGGGGGGDGSGVARPEDVRDPAARKRLEKQRRKEQRAAKFSAHQRRR